MFKDKSVGQQATFQYHLEAWKTKTEIFKTTEEIDENIQRPIPSLKSILKANATGKKLRHIYSAKKCFTEGQRVLLINTIAKFIEANGFKCSVHDCSMLEKEICRLFPTEELSYYTTGKRGKLYHKIYNIKRQSNSLKDETDMAVIEQTFEPEPDYEFALKMLKENSSTEEFDIFWRQCAKYRLTEIKNLKTTAAILQKWPEYKKPSSAHLISIDYSIKYPHSKDINIKWQECGTKMFDLLGKKLTHSAIITTLSKCVNEESKIFGTFWFFHYMFPPVITTITAENGTKERKKYTFVDSQESFAIVGKTGPEMEAKLNLLKLQKTNIQPLLLVIGDIYDIKSIVVYFDGIRYPIPKTLSAIDTLFKIIFLFDLDFPKPAEIFYIFLQTFFYGLPTNKVNTKVSSVSNELNM